MRTLRVALMGAAALALRVAPLAAQQLTQKFDYRPVHQVQEVGLELEKIWVRRISFRPAGAPPHRAVPEAVVRIENESDAAAAVGVAIVLFDADGNIVAAGAGGTRVGWLAAGERDTSIIRFPYVFRNVDKARTFTLTMEIQKKEATKAAP